jgi:hypothetical protein
MLKIMLFSSEVDFHKLADLANHGFDISFSEPIH